MEDTTKKIILYRIILSVFLFIAAALLVLSLAFSDDYLNKFSVDKSIQYSTLQRLHIIKTVGFIAGISFASLFFYYYFRRELLIRHISRHQNKIINLFLLIFVIIVFFIISELGLRLIIKNETSLYGVGPGSLEFNKNHVTLNNENMRDYNFTLVKGKDTIRIVGLGDSFVYGAGVNDVDDTYFKILEKYLNSMNKSKYEVYNFGVPGAFTESEIALLKEKGLKYDPSIIIVGYNVNDFLDVDDSVKNYNSIITLPVVGFWLRNYFYTYYFAESRFNNILERLGYKETYEDYILRSYDSEINKEYNSKVIKELADVSKENNLTVVFVIFPMIYRLDSYPLSPIVDFAKAEAKKNGFYVIDLLPVYSDYNESDIVVNPFDTHPNELGQMLAANQTFIKMKDYKLV